MNHETYTVCVAAKKIEATDICSFELVSVERNRLPPSSAGPHVDVQVPGGMTCQYSLCNDSAESHRYLICVINDPATRGGSKVMHDGDDIVISAPKNHFQIVNEARRSVLLAGGIGITPILCMVERLATTGTDFELHFCTRTPARTAFRNRVERSMFTSTRRAARAPSQRGTSSICRRNDP